MDEGSYTAIKYLTKNSEAMTPAHALRPSKRCCMQSALIVTAIRDKAQQDGFRAGVLWGSLATLGGFLLGLLLF